MSVILKQNNVYSWFSEQGISVKGYVFDKNDQLIKDQELLNVFTQVKSALDLKETLQSLNGFFAVVIDKDELRLAAVDRIRSHPLFYQTNGNSISDEAIQLADLNIDEQQAKAFTLSTYALGSATLLVGVNQLQAGEMLEVKNGQAISSSYYEHSINSFHKGTDLIKAAEKVSTSAFTRFVNSMGDKPIMLGLTAGLDSRFIACMLKKMGRQNVSCFTYGSKNSYEAKIAEQVAKQLGFPWHFVEFDEEVFSYFFSEEYQAYELQATNYSCLAYEQDLLAIHQLKEDSLVPKDAVFVPGFCGDLLAGSWMFKQTELSKLQYNKEGLAHYIGKNPKFFAQNKDAAYWEGVDQLISKDTVGYQISNELDMASSVQAWGVKHRISKYLINSMRTYEFIGHEWRLPLWDKEYTDFWYQVSIEERRDKKLYKQFLHEHLFKPMGVDIHYQKIDDQFTHAGILTKLRAWSPKPIRKIFKRMLVKTKDQDINNFNKLYQMIHARTHGLVKPDNDINFIEAYWYIERLRAQNK